MLVSHLVDQPLEDAGGQERADEDDAREHLGAFERARLAQAGAPVTGARYAPAADAAAAGSVSEPRPGLITLAPETVAGAACRAWSSAPRAARRCRPARAPARLGLGALGLLVGLALLARLLLFLLLGGGGGVVRLGRLLFGAACVGLAQLCT